MAYADPESLSDSEEDSMIDVDYSSLEPEVTGVTLPLYTSPKRVPTITAVQPPAASPSPAFFLDQVSHMITQGQQEM